MSEVPELAGCAADGHTHKLTLSNVEVIIGSVINEHLAQFHSSDKNISIPEVKSPIIHVSRYSGNSPGFHDPAIAETPDHALYR